MSQTGLHSEKGTVAPTAQPQTPASNRTAAFVDRRLEPRYPTHDPAEVKVLPAGGVGTSGIVMDVSRLGLRVVLPSAIHKGVEVKVTIEPGVVVLGQVRYCRRILDGFHAGISIREVVYSSEEQDQHIQDDRLALYAAGKGLSAPEVLKLKDHVVRCAACRNRWTELLGAPES
jgi:hypothetical protein